VTIVIVGEDGDFGPRVLDNSKNNFERGKKDSFTLQSPGLGNLKSVRISHDNSGLGAAWFLDKVVVTDASTGEAITFPCGRWLAKDEDDGAISRELTREGTWATVPYKVGYEGPMCPLIVTRGPLRSARGDTVALDASGTFESRYCRLVCTRMPFHQASDESFASSRHFSLCSISTINHGNLTSTNGSQIHVLTSDKRFAGTSANVHCELFGKLGGSGRAKLENSKDNFQRGRTDIFTVECRELGELTRMTIGHDNKGSGPGWHLGSVKVEAPTLGLIFPVECGQWLAADEGDGQLERELVFVKENAIKVARKSVWHCAVTTSDKRSAGTDSNVFMVVYGTQGKSEVIPVKSQSDTFERGKTDEFKVGAHFRSQPLATSMSCLSCCCGLAELGRAAKSWLVSG